MMLCILFLRDFIVVEMIHASSYTYVPRLFLIIVKSSGDDTEESLIWDLKFRLVSKLSVLL